MKRGTDTELIYGVHPVLEALRSDPRRVDRVYVIADRRGPQVGQALRLARGFGVAVTHLPRPVFERKIRARGHQGMAAAVAAVPYADPDELCRTAASQAESILVILDGVEDVGNLGAILRTCAAVGVDGVVLPVDGSAGLTPAVAKASAGTAATVAVARDPKLGRRVESLRDAGFSIVVLDPRGTDEWGKTPLGGRLAVIAGGEARGVRRSLVRHADRRLRLPLAAGVESLNVSVALGVVLYESVRQRGKRGGES